MFGKTLKQRRWLRKYLELGNATRAAMEVYDINSYESAMSIGEQNLRKLDKDYGTFDFWLEKEGVSDKRLASTLSNGLEATRVFSSYTEADKEVPDWSARLKATDIALKVKGKYPKENENNVNVGFNILINGN